MGTVKDKFERDRAVLSEENKKLAAEKERVMEGSGVPRGGGNLPLVDAGSLHFKYFYFSVK